MTIEVGNLSDTILTLTVRGKLTQSELAAAQKTAADLIRKHGNIRVLVLADQFAGWERQGDWNDLSFQAEHDRNIERMAIVGDEKWRDLALVFTAQGLREFPIEYFATADLARARAWLAAP